MYNVTVQQDNLPKGAEVQIPGLGVFENGSTTFVDKEDAEAYRTFNSNNVDVLGKDGEPTGELVWTQGPTLLEASKGMVGVEVETASKPSSSSSRSTSTATTSESSGGEQ